MTAVGIVGGLGVGATVHYYEQIAAACKARGIVPDLVIAHADVDYGQSLVRAGQLEALAAYLAGFIDRLARAGAQAAAIPAVTPHICVKELEPLLKIPLINIVEVLAAELRTRGIKRVALMGSVFTVQGSLWGQLSGLEIVKPQPDEIAFIGQAYQRILDGRSQAIDVDRLRGIAVELQRREGVETILLAGTDLAVMFDEATAGFPCLDVSRLHIDAIVKKLTARGHEDLVAIAAVDLRSPGLRALDVGEATGTICTARTPRARRRSGRGSGRHARPSRARAPRPRSRR